MPLEHLAVHAHRRVPEAYRVGSALLPRFLLGLRVPEFGPFSNLPAASPTDIPPLVHLSQAYNPGLGSGSPGLGAVVLRGHLQFRRYLSVDLDWCRMCVRRQGTVCPPLGPGLSPASQAMAYES
jgi:hypothetical protein